MTMNSLFESPLKAFKLTVLSAAASVFLLSCTSVKEANVPPGEADKLMVVAALGLFRLPDAPGDERGQPQLDGAGRRLVVLEISHFPPRSLKVGRGYVGGSDLSNPARLTAWRI